MLQRINNYLLTHYPLVWNTRLLWVSAVNLLLHLSFFIGGFAAISATSIADNYTVGSVGGFGLYALTVLCGLLVLIVWCVFYLRNNAFKNFYRIGKWWLVKEFILIFFLIATSITYFMSFQWGVRTRVRSITSREQLVQEVNAVNTAAVYLPYEKAPYFILNNCAEKSKSGNEGSQQAEITSFDTIISYSSTDTTISASRKKLDAQIKEALRHPGAFSYLHYCKKLVTVSVGEGESTISERNRKWLQQGRKDSVRTAMQALFTVLKKYDIEYRLNTDTILREVFSDSLFSVNRKIANTRYSFPNGYEIENPFYVDNSNLDEAFRLIKSCQLTAENLDDRVKEWVGIGYATLGLSVLLLCYRRFSRKVFLISTVGTLVWMVLIGLLSAGSRSGAAFFWIMLILNASFLGIGLSLLRQKTRKTLSGVLLSWHVYVVYAMVPCIAALFQLYYQDWRSYGAYASVIEKQRQYPISYWVTEHMESIFIVNLVATFIYVTLLFNQWTKQWQASPEE